MNRYIPACVVAGSLALMTAPPLAPAFEVIKNVNDGRPLTDRLVLFDKQTGAKDLDFTDSADCRITVLPDGALESRIIGRSEVQPTIRWPRRGDMPATFDARQYGYLVLTCRVEGVTRQAVGNGKTI